MSIKLIFFGVFLLVQTTVSSCNSILKVEADHGSASTFSIKQEKDSLTSRSKYNIIDKLFDEQQYSNAVELGLTFLNTLNKNEDKELEFLTTFLMGNSFYKMRDFDKALNYYKKSLNIYNLYYELKQNEELKPSISKESRISYVKNLLNIGDTYFRLKEKDSAIIYFKNVENTLFFIKEIKAIKASSYTNLSAIYLQDSLYDKARIYALKAVNIGKSNNNKVSEAAALGNLASIYLEEKKYEEAKLTYTKAIDLLEKENSTNATLYKEKLYYNLAWTLFLLKDYMAYDYQEKSYIIKDSLRNAEFEQIVQQAYEKYQFQISKENAIKAEAEEKRSAWFFGALALLILISSAVMLYNYKLRQNNLKLKLDQTQLSQKSKLEKLKSESQVRILNATLDGKETERKQIAETLHDSVSSLLSSANLHLQATKMQFNGDTPVEIDKTQKIIIEASQTIRDLSHTLVSSVLLKFGLKYAIKDMADKFSNSQISIETKIKNVRRYHQNFEIKVNNIIQEFVNNILKHSNATKAIVKIEDREGKLLIQIKDNGQGFDKQEAVKKDGLGINQIDARIQMMEGEFHIDTNAEEGTKIDIVLPILEKEVTRV